MITFSCECGKRYQVKDDLAGKRGKCTCGKSLTIPQSIGQQVTTPWLSCEVGTLKVEQDSGNEGAKLAALSNPHGTNAPESIERIPETPPAEATTSQTANAQSPVQRKRPVAKPAL